jgi:hypothetical protein
VPFTNSSPITPFPQPFPTVSGVNITASVFLESPAMVSRAITDFTVLRFLMPRVFSRGPTATGGSVVFDQVTGTFFFLDRDVQEIRPGSMFPILAGGEQLPGVAVVRKLGGEVMLTYEAIRRDNRPLITRELQRLANTVVRNVDATAVATLNAAPILTATTASTWGTAGSDPLSDIATAAQLVYGPDMGYLPDTILLNPYNHAAAIKNTTLRTALPREDTTDRNPIFGGHLNMLEGLDFYLSNRVPQGTCYILEGGRVGSYSEEVPEYYQVLDDPRAETKYIHGARVIVPYVTDPQSCVKMTGLGTTGSP